MTTEQSFFLNVLSDHLNNRKTCKSSINLDWSNLLHFARIHQVEGIIYQQCKDFLPNEIKNNLYIKYCSTLSNYAKRRYLTNNILNKLSSEGIEYFIVKGICVASFYPYPALRTMGDTDLVVHTEVRNQVHKILLEEGFENKSRLENREWVYYKENFELELHDHLIYSEAINRKELEDFFSDFWVYLKDGELNWNYHFLYLLLHLRKHLMNSGVGFRQFYDIAVLTKNNNYLDWTYIEEQLIQLDLIEFSKVVLTLNETWFGVKSKLKFRQLDDLFFKRATEYIFVNGVFGFDNADNLDNVSINNARNSNNQYLGMIKTAIRRVFPSYETLIVVPKYSFLKRKKWLLPWAWIYRLINGMNRNRIINNVNSVKSTFVSSESIEKRNEWFRQWGLDDT